MAATIDRTGARIHDLHGGSTAGSAWPRADSPADVPVPVTVDDGSLGIGGVARLRANDETDVNNAYGTTPV